MSENNNKVVFGQTKNSLVTDSLMFLPHELEPADNYRSFSDDEIKRELYGNRFFLKQRVWRNMRKMQRHHQTQYGYIDPVFKSLRPRYP